MSLGKTRKAPRVVVVSRASIYQELIERHATRQQAEFFLKSRGQSLEPVDRAHLIQEAAIAQVFKAVPKEWRSAKVSRTDLDRFDFEARDLIIAVGQDGLVANLSKYLDGQSVIGVNPDPQHSDGVLCKHGAGAIPTLLNDAKTGQLRTENRCMVLVQVDDGQSLLALNEIFVGHQSHQSARYQIEHAGTGELQSSSGLIVSTGTGATGWARSIAGQRAAPPSLPAPCDASLVFFVRECFPSVTTGTEIDAGHVGPDMSLRLTSHMNEGGVIFGDGIEGDRIAFHWGMRAEISIAEQGLNLAL